MPHKNALIARRVGGQVGAGGTHQRRAESEEALQAGLKCCAFQVVIVLGL